VRGAAAPPGFLPTFAGLLISLAGQRKRDAVSEQSVSE
jgi:hypothetical protein